MSLRDRDRLSVLRQVEAGWIPPWRGAELLGLLRRQFRRLGRRFEVEGDAAVIPGHRGRRPTLLAEHLARDPEIGPINPYTLRGWLTETGLWKVRSSATSDRWPSTPIGPVISGMPDGTPRGFPRSCVRPRRRPPSSAALYARAIDLILAHSPQAKGRLEHDFGTSRDRSFKELRVAHISTGLMGVKRVFVYSEADRRKGAVSSARNALQTVRAGRPR